DRVALEETLVDRVQEVLLLGDVVQPVGCVLDGPVEAVQRAQEAVAVERQAHQGVDDLLHLDGDDVAARELGIPPRSQTPQHLSRMLEGVEIKGVRVFGTASAGVSCPNRQKGAVLWNANSGRYCTTPCSKWRWRSSRSMCNCSPGWWSPPCCGLPSMIAPSAGLVTRPIGARRPCGRGPSPRRRP